MPKAVSRRELDAAGSAVKETSYHHRLDDIDSIIETTFAPNGSRSRNGTANLYMLTPGESVSFDVRSRLTINLRTNLA